MKRLLAYLFIVIGLGLTFSVNAKASELAVLYSNSDKIKIFIEYGSSGSLALAENHCNKFGKTSKPGDSTYNAYHEGKKGSFIIYSCEGGNKKISKNDASHNSYKCGDKDWMGNTVCGEDWEKKQKNKISLKKKINTNLNVNDYIFYAFEYPNIGTIASFYKSSTRNINEAILLLKNGECKFGTSIDKLIENSKYESSFDFKCSYVMRDKNIYARIQNKVNISIYPKDMKVRGINSIGKTITKVRIPGEILSLAKFYNANKLIKQIEGDKSKTKIAKDETSQTKKIARNNKTINYSDGTKYIGETQNGKPNGFGTYTWSNGDKYVGNWKDNKLHGQGTFTSVKGNKYVGEFNNDNRTGYGTLITSNGDKIEGNFIDGKLNGNAYQFEASTGRFLVGIYKDNIIIDGEAELYDSSGKYLTTNVYENNTVFKDNKFNGSGYFVFADTGDVVVGTYKNGKIIDGDAEVYDSSGKYSKTYVYGNSTVIKQKNEWLKKRKKTLAEALEENNLKFEDTETVIVKKEQKKNENKNQKVAKVSEENQKEIKIKTKELDTEGPKILIAETITVDDSSYSLKGKVSDAGSDKIYLKIDGQDVPLKKGSFKVDRYSPNDEEIKIVAIDKWGNESTKMIKVIVDIKEETVVEKLEPLNPSTIKAKSSGEKVALIIGIENYIEVPKANYANLDAEYFSDYARKVFGVKKQNINLLVDENASFVKTNKALTLWLKSKIKAKQTDLVVFFAGHGLASNDGKELYLLPQDSDPNLLDITALSRTKLFQTIIDLKPKSVTMFLDTCYSGVSRDEQMLLASARPIRIVADEQEGIPDNFTIFTASQVEQISSGLKEANHGIFSYYLMKGLEGKADSNQDNKITNGELLTYMDENVSQKAAELGREQNPSLAGDPDKILISYR